MNKIAKIQEEYKEVTSRLRNEMQAAYHEILVNAGLDGDVIQRDNGKCGVIRVQGRECNNIDAEYEFYPYRINGELSKSHQHVWVSSDYRPDGEERMKQELLSKYDLAPKEVEE